MDATHDGELWESSRPFLVVPESVAPATGSGFGSGHSRGCLLGRRPVSGRIARFGSPLSGMLACAYHV